MFPLAPPGRVCRPLHDQVEFEQRPGVALVLITDGGAGQACAGARSSDAEFEALFAAAAPAITTYVVSVYSDPEARLDVRVLNAWARAGGTGSAFLLVRGAPRLEAWLRPALERVREAASSCPPEVGPVIP